MVQANAEVESCCTSAMCQGTAVACRSVKRDACSCDGCSLAVWARMVAGGNGLLCRASPTPQHSPSAPGLCISGLASQRVRDLLANVLGTPGSAGEEPCLMLCVRWRSCWGQTWHESQTRNSYAEHDSSATHASCL